MMRALDDTYVLTAETRRVVKLFVMALAGCVLIVGVLAFVYWVGPPNNALHSDPDKTFCTMLLSEKMNQTMAWDTTHHEARVWLKLCLVAQRYYPYQQEIPKEAALWYDGTADRIYEQYLKPQ